MKAIKRIIASVFVCMFAVTGGLNALALTPTEDSSTVVSQPVSEGISSETSSQTFFRAGEFRKQQHLPFSKCRNAFRRD